MKRLLAWITILCILLGHVSPLCTALAMEEDGARDLAMSENATDAANFTKTIVAGDGSTFEIRVTYGGEIGIPAEGTELAVKELLPGDAEYDYYIEESAAKLNKTADELTYSRLFDIKIVDAANPELVYEPTGDVSVSIRLVGEQLNEYDNVDVLHFTEDEAKKSCTIETVESSVEGENLEFTTDSFSVYVVVAHEGGDVVTPRVMFHFISPDAEELDDGSVAFYNGTPYSFVNKNDETQTTQILDNGKSLELIVDPLNHESKYFYGWYLVNPYVIDGTTNAYGINESNNHLYYTWPDSPKAITFEHPISITESGNTVNWELNGASGSGVVDSDGNVHAFLVPIYENYNFVNFMQLPRDAGSSVNGASNLMTRKLIAKGSSNDIKVKISDVRAVSEDQVHLLFVGWEYYDPSNPNCDANGYVWIQTVDYSGAEMSTPGEDGVYLSKSGLDDADSIDLYPVFVSARWVDFTSGISGSGALFVGSRFRESWGTPDAPISGMNPDTAKNIFDFLPCSSRAGYQFDGWYFLAVMDKNTGEITNLNSASADIILNYYDALGVHTVKITNQTAIKITNSDGSIHAGSEGIYWVVVDGNDDQGNTIAHITNNTLGANENAHPLFEIFYNSNDAKHALKLYDGLDRLSLCANWAPSNSEITVIYWTENALTKEDVLQGRTAEYTASAIKNIQTSDLSIQLGTTIASGSTLTLNNLQSFKFDLNNDGDVDDEVDLSALNNEILDDIGAVPGKEVLSSGIVIPGDELFYELNNSLSDNSVVIKGDGSTVFNVYFSRKEFTLVFHIGRDGHVKNRGQMKDESYPDWDGNWLEYMYKDDEVTALLGHEGQAPDYSHNGLYSMTYKAGTPEEKTADSTYVTTYDYSVTPHTGNIMGNYVPGPDENLYTITAKFGSYIGDRWPSPVNPNFTFVDKNGSSVTMYIWTAYYNSLYARIANKRPTTGGNTNGNNSDINGIYEYMSKELCSNRAGTGIIENKVHHMVAYFGPKNNDNRYKRYHILVEAMPGSYDPNDPNLLDGNDYTVYSLTTWSENNTDKSKSQIIDHHFFEIEANEVISNVQPQYQLTSDIDGYDFVYSCYNGTQQFNSQTGHYEYDIYFFFTPVSNYTLTFKYENAQDVKTDTYYFGQSLANAKKPSYVDPSKDGYTFLGWYDNEAGAGDPFDFANETMPSHSIVLYPVFKKLDYIVTYDPNGAEIDHWRQTSTTKNDSTGFRADYHETISPYNDLIREYIETTSDEIATLLLNSSTEVYYYMRTRYLSPEHDGRYIPSDLRDALFLTESEIVEYWNHYQNYPEYKFTERGATKFDNKDAWMDAYFGDHVLSNLQKYRKTLPTESYFFVGWYEVINGVLASAPYDFNTKLEHDTELRALWRLDGGFYLQYKPIYYYDDGTVQRTIVGHMTNDNDNNSLPTDPTDISIQLYADQSRTHVLQAPTGFDDDIVFRGWIIVDGEGNPLQFDTNNQPIYYQPGDDFIVDSRYAENLQQGSVIHMQAVYVLKDDSARKPDVADMILDANGGTIDSSVGTLPTLTVGTTVFYPLQNPTQIKFNDIQANQSLHLYRYSTSKTYGNVTGTNFFNHSAGYLLIGFDEGTDATKAYNEATAPDGLHSGSPFVPTFAADSVVAVEPGSITTLYAVWEPMVYLTLENDTYEDIVVYINCANPGAIQIVNKATGDFGRTGLTTTNSTVSVTIPAKVGDDKGSIKLVFPFGDGEDFTATATNTHLQKKMSVKRLDLGATSPVAGSQNVTYNNTVSISGTLGKTNLAQDSELKGVIVTYTEIPDEKVVFDVNGGNWSDQTLPFDEQSTGRYAIKHEDITANAYEPNEPTKSGKIFVGWLAESELQKLVDNYPAKVSSLAAALSRYDWSDANSNAGYTIDGTNYVNLLAFLKANKWDFNNSPPYNQVLYAIWSNTVNVTFDISRDSSNNHIWSGPATTDVAGSYVYYRNPSDSSTITYTLMKGDLVPEPFAPTAEDPNWLFISWLNNDSTFKGKTVSPETTKGKQYNFLSPVTSNKTLHTSWMAETPRTFTFEVYNELVNGDPNEEFTYTINVTDEWVRGRLGSSNSTSNGVPDRQWGSLTTSLKSGEHYTVTVTISCFTVFQGDYSVRIDVTDSSGSLIKSGHVIYCNNNSAKNFVSHYKFTLTIEQVAKQDYDTHVMAINKATGDPDIIGNASDCSYTFFSSTARPTESNENNSQFSPFLPVTNGYYESTTGYPRGENENVQINFTNTKKLFVAPTDYHDSKSPYLWLFAAGMVLFAVAIIYSRRKAIVQETSYEKSSIK